MKSLKEVKSKAEELLADERLHYPPANVFVNAPLALIQVELTAKINILNWVLEQDAVEIKEK